MKDKESINQALIYLLIRQYWILCSNSVEGNPDYPAVVPEKVLRYEIEGSFAEKYKNPVLIEYDVSRSYGKFRYLLHESSMTPIICGEDVSNAVANIAKEFTSFLQFETDANYWNIDLWNVYGQLGSENENRVVYTQKHLKKGKKRG